MPNVWLRGPLPDLDPMLQPVGHALLQAREDLTRVVSGLSDSELWSRPGAAPPPGFHVKHAMGSLERLMTYARGAELSPAQQAALAAEQTGGDSPEALLRRAHEVIDAALTELRTISAGRLLEPRAVGRAGLPSTLLGILVHAAEHTTRHVGQLITTVSVLRGSAGGIR